MFKPYISKLPCHCFLSSGLLLPPLCQPSPPLSHLPRNHGGDVYDPGRSVPSLCRPPPFPPTSCLCASKIGQPFNICPSPSRQPPPSSAQPGSTRAASLPCRSSLSTLQCAVDWWQAIWDLPAAAVPVSSSAAFSMAVKSSVSSPLSSPPHQPSAQLIPPSSHCPSPLLRCHICC